MKQAENPLLVDLALQGGGSNGAFTWGVLDRLLEESRLRIEAISGTSAGALNAAALADGWTEGGASFEIVRLRSTSCLYRPVYVRCSEQSKSMVRRIGMEDMLEIRPSHR